MENLGAVDDTRNRLSQLEEMCKKKDEEIRWQENTITTLTRMDQKKKADIEQKEAKIKKDQQELEQEKAKQDKRVTMAIAEEKLKLKSELDELQRQHNENHGKRRKELEDEFAQKNGENKRRITALEDEKKQLSMAVEQLKRKVKIQSEELGKTTEQCDVLERAKDSFKRDMNARDKELKAIKNEFALNTKSKDYLYEFWPYPQPIKGYIILTNISTQSFAEIYGQIEEISLKYFNDIDGKVRTLFLSATLSLSCLLHIRTWKKYTRNWLQ